MKVRLLSLSKVPVRDVKQKDHYYPFGLNISALSSTSPLSKPNQFKIQGKELQGEFDLNWYDFGARNYDPTIGRWTSVDPLGDVLSHLSPYNYVENNPLSMIDPDGRLSTHTDEEGNVLAVYDDDDLGVYQHSDVPDDVASSDVSGGKKLKAKDGKKMGETLEWNSFLVEGEPARGVAGKIDFGTFDAAESIVFGLQKFLGKSKSLEGAEIGALVDYMLNANNGQEYDLKAKGGEVGDIENYYRGSQLAPGKYVTARDAGNYLAGSIARVAGVSDRWTYAGFGALQKSGNNTTTAPLYFIGAFSSSNYGERPISHAFQKRGYNRNKK
jgi:RHS repeat-associated protein